MAEEVIYDELEGEEEEEHHEGQWLIKWGLPVVYVGLLIAFGVQTWELVIHLFPAENLFMQVATVFSFDIMAAVWLGVKTFGRFRLYGSYSLVKWMWRITFALATIASVIQMYLNAVRFLYQSVNPNIIYFAYALVIVAFTGNLIALSNLLGGEHDARHPVKIIGSGYKPKVVNRPRATLQRAKRTVAQTDDRYTPLTVEERKAMLEETRALYREEMAKLLQSSSATNTEELAVSPTVHNGHSKNGKKPNA